MQLRRITSSVVLWLASCGSEGAQPSNTDHAAPGPFTLTVSNLVGSEACTGMAPDTCPIIEEQHTSVMDAPNISPEFRWTGTPAGTRSFALTLTDLSFGQPLWAIWNIPGDTNHVPPDIPKDSPVPAFPAGSQQVNATFAPGAGYFGPQAPCNVYQFELFALSVERFEPTQPEFVTLVRTELHEATQLALGYASLTARNNHQMQCE